MLTRQAQEISAQSNHPGGKKSIFWFLSVFSLVPIPCISDKYDYHHLIGGSLWETRQSQEI